MKYLSLIIFLSLNTFAQQSYIDYLSPYHPVVGKSGMVVSQNNLSSDIGIEILNKGGNAVDAAVAVGFSLAITLPRAGNLGGGGFMLVYLKEKDEIFYIDYRSKSPLNSTIDNIFDLNGKTIKPKDSQRIIRAIEVITLTGMSINDSLSSVKPSRLEEKFELVEFGIFPKERSELHKRIESRQDKLVGENLLEEIIQIKSDFNISSTHPAMKAINYRQGLNVIEGKLERSQLFEKSLFATRQFAKRQCTWMRGWENLRNFDLYQWGDATEELKKQLNLLEII